MRAYIRANVTMPTKDTDIIEWKQHLPKPPLNELKNMFDRGDVYYWTIKVCFSPHRYVFAVEISYILEHRLQTSISVLRFLESVDVSCVLISLFQSIKVLP